MKRLKTLSLLLAGLMALPATLYAQDDIALDTYSSSDVVKEYPVSSYGEKIKLPFFTHPACVSLAAKGNFNGMYVVWEDYTSQETNTWIVKEHPDSSYTTSRLRLQKVDARGLDSHYYEQETVKTADYKHGLELVWDREKDKLYHKWSGKVKRNDKLIKKGEMMPEFSVPLLNDSNYNYHSGQDNILVINWWQTTCLPCIEEMPGLNKLVNKYSDKENIEFLAIAWNKKDDLKEFLQEHDFAYRQALYNQQASQLFGAAFPRNVIVNSNGEIVYNHLGGSEDQWKEMDQVLSGLIKR